MGINIGVFPGDGVTTVSTPVSQDATGIRYTVDVIRQHSVARDVLNGAKEIELVRPGGTLVNVGHGPQLPSNPYEGQVWILT